MTFSDRIETLIGSYPYGTRLEQILDEAARLLIAELPEPMLMSFATEETDDGTSGVDVTNKRIVKAHKDGYPARLIDETLRTRLTNTAEPTPVYYVLNNTAYVKPEGGTITTIAFPNIKRSDTTVSGWGTMLVDLLVERAALLILDIMMVDVREGYGTSVTLPTIPDAPAAPSFVTSDAAAVAPSVTTISALPTAPVYTEPSLDSEVAAPSVSSLSITETAPTAPAAPSIFYTDAAFVAAATTSIAELGTAPAYTKPIFEGSLALPSLPSLDLTTEADGITALDPPSALVAPSISHISANASSVVANTLSALGAPPTYNKPVFGGLLDLPSFPSLDLTTEADGTTSLNPPSAPAAPSIAHISASASNVVANTLSSLGTAPTYNKPAFGGSLSIPTLPTLDLETKIDGSSKNIPSPPAAPSFAYTNAAAATVNAVTVAELGTAPNYTKSTVALDFTEYETYEGEEDSEMMNAILSRIGTQLADKETDIKDEINEFQKELVAYQQDAQRKIEQARTTLQEALLDARSSTDVDVQNQLRAFEAQVQEYQSELARYETQLSEYASDTQAQLEEYQAAFQNAFSTWREQQALYLQQYAQDVQNETAEFQKELVIYQQDAQHKIEQVRTTLQESLQNARLSTDVDVQNKARDLEAAIADFQANVSVFESELRRYQSEIDRQIQTFQLELQKSFEPWQQQQTLYMQQYAQDVQNEANEFQKELAIYQQDAQHKIEQARTTLQESLQDARLSTDVDVQNRARELEAAIADFQADVSVFQSGLQRYEAEIARQVQTFQLEYQKEFESWQRQQALYMEKYAQDLQNESAEFQKELSIYQQDAAHKIEQARIALQEALSDAQSSTDVNVRNKAASLEAAIQDYNLELSLFQSKLNLYQAKVEVELQEYSAALDREIQLYGTQNSIKIERYGTLLQNARSKFEKELAVYNAGVQLNNLQAEIAAREASQTASDATNVALQNKARQLEKEVQEYQSVIAKYQSDLQSYSQQVDAALSNQGVLTESVAAKIRMLAFDKERHESRYMQRFRAFMRAFYPRKSYTIKQHAI